MHRVLEAEAKRGNVVLDPDEKHREVRVPHNQTRKLYLINNQRSRRIISKLSQLPARKQLPANGPGAFSNEHTPAIT